jgi:hypothetical protein
LGRQRAEALGSEISVRGFQPAGRLAPAVAPCRFRREQPGQVAEGTRADVGTGGAGEPGRPVAVSCSPRQDGVGIAERAAVEAGHGNGGTPRFSQHGPGRPAVACGGQHQRPQRAEHRGLGVRQRAQDGHAAAEGVHRAGQVTPEQG